MCVNGTYKLAPYEYDFQLDDDDCYYWAVSTMTQNDGMLVNQGGVSCCTKNLHTYPLAKLWP